MFRRRSVPQELCRYADPTAVAFLDLGHALTKPKRLRYFFRAASQGQRGAEPRELNGYKIPLAKVLVKRALAALVA